MKGLQNSLIFLHAGSVNESRLEVSQSFSVTTNLQAGFESSVTYKKSLEMAPALKAGTRW